MDEQAFLEKFMRGGGGESEGRAILDKMRTARSKGSSGQSDFFKDPAALVPGGTSLPSGATLIPELSGSKAVTRPETSRENSELDRPLTMTARERDLLELSVEMETLHAKECGMMGYLATALVYASLPHSQIDGAVFKRRNGPYAMTVLNDPEIGLPYGKIPRIITAFLCTEAKRTNERVVTLGRSQAAFLSKIGMTSSGGRNGTLGRVDDQSRRLLTSTITLTSDENDQFRWKKVSIAESGCLLWDPHRPDEDCLWESTLTLSEPFFREASEHGVPIDMRALHQLRSPLGIDLYLWLTYRLHRLSKPTPVSWSQIKNQFGSNYANTHRGLLDFIARFKVQLKTVRTLYPDAKVEVGKTGVTLYPSRPHVRS